MVQAEANDAARRMRCTVGGPTMQRREVLAPASFQADDKDAARSSADRRGRPRPSARMTGARPAADRRPAPGGISVYAAPAPMRKRRFA